MEDIKCIACGQILCKWVDCIEGYICISDFVEEDKPCRECESEID